MKPGPFRLERYFARYEFTAPYLLCSSDCESITTVELLDMEPGGREALEKLWLGYTESPGSPALRQEISGLYRNIHPDEVLVHSGAEEVIYTFMNSILKPGDHVILHYPCYQSLEELPLALGCDVTRWTASEENGWELDVEFLKENIRENTRLIIINSPHNPTGYIMSEEKLKLISDIASKHEIYLLSDEVYRFLEFSPEDALQPACDLYENAVSIGVMSKAFGLAGLRIGWAAARNKSVLKAMAEFKDYTTICSSAPSELLAAIALRNRYRILDRNMAIIKTNIKLLDDFFKKYNYLFGWNRPKAGSVAFPRLRINTRIEDFAERLVTEKGALLLPGNCFAPGYNNFRLGFGRKNLSDGLEKLEEFLAEHY